MTPSLLALSLLLPIGSDDALFQNLKDRERHPFAPTLPLLTEKEEAVLDHVIDRFMLADIGRLRGFEARKALADFSRLGPEAIPALIRGINRSAAINDSCPVIVIAKMLDRHLRNSEDLELLDFARDEIGAGVGPTRHAAVLKDLRFKINLRKNAVARIEDARKRKAAKRAAAEAEGTPLDTSPAAMSTGELAKALETTRGGTLAQVLDELGGRNDAEALEALALASKSVKDEDNLRLARSLLVKNMAKRTDEVIRRNLNAEQAELRGAAIFAVYKRKLPWIGELIDRLDDDEPGVRKLAHQALVKLTKQNLGPAVNATAAERKKAMEAWRAWHVDQQP